MFNYKYSCFEATMCAWTLVMRGPPLRFGSVIGRALSFSKPGETFDLLLKSC